MRTPYDAVLQVKYKRLLQVKYKRLMDFIEQHDLLDLWEDMVADDNDLTIVQLINLAEALINKNNLRCRD